MNAPTNSPVRFGVFELDTCAGELRRNGCRVALQPQPLEILRVLIERPGQVVTRQELCRRLWTNGANVDFDRSLNKAIVKLRDALGDEADSPRYIETLPRRGYRFIPVPQVHAHVDAAGTNADVTISRSTTSPAPARPTKWAPLGWIGGTLALVLLWTFWAIVNYRAASKPAEQTGAETVPAAIHSLAVLPLENLSGDKEQDYFADGMTDALTTGLAQIGSLRVISRTSAMQFKGSKERLPQLGRDLQVDAVVEGTVVRGENGVRITVQLIEASSDRHLWANSYERSLKDVLVLQDQIARDVAEQIRVKLTPNERSLLKQVHVVDPEAHDAYLRGRYWWHTRTVEGLRRGLDYFQQAVAKDPTFAPAYAGVADSLVVMVWNFGLLPANEAFPKAKEAASRALELDPSLGEARASLAMVKFAYDRDWLGAEQEFKRAIALRPNYAQAHHYYSYYLMAMGRLDEAVNGFERARELDPYAYHVNWSLGTALYFARRYDDALRQYRRTLEMFPDRRADLYDTIANVYEARKMFAEAFAAHREALSLRNDPNGPLLERAYKHFGYSGYVRRQIEILEQAPQPERTLSRWYALVNDEAHALAYLERDYDERFPWLLMVQVNPMFDSIRSSPRFRDLVHRIGFPQPLSAQN